MSTLLVVAKAPIPGAVKTRLCPTLTPLQAAALAAAALLDTLAAVRAVDGARHVVALAGSLRDAVDGRELAGALRGMTVIGQRGGTFADRLTHAHLDAAGPTGAVLQIGMDTPQVTPELLRAGLAAVDGAPGTGARYRGQRGRHGFREPGGRATGSAGIGPAADGGWWGLALRHAGDARCLRHVAMSTPHTRRDTVTALTGLGLPVVELPELIDVDHLADARAVAECAPQTSFARCAADILPRGSASARASGRALA